jgi:hypothetical protein
MAIALPASSQPVRKVRVTAQQVAFLMLTEGAASVEKLHHKPGCEIAAATFNGAIELLATQTQQREALETLRDTLLGGSEAGERGRPAAKVGESRVYKTQQVGDSDPFVRLPVGLLGALKGQTVTVSFGNGVITVKL